MRNLYAERAQALVGCRFRPQGRDPTLGLDCVGLIVAAFGIPPEQVDRRYRLRGDHLRKIEKGLAPFFQCIPASRCVPGDVLLFAIASEQAHLAIRTERGFVHADAGLRRIVETPGEAPWTLVSAFRRRARRKRGE